MIKYAKVIDDEKGLCYVALGTNTDKYIEMGYTLLDVDLSDIDDNWYLASKCPHKSEEEKLKEAKDAKYQEALIGAKDFIENKAVYQFDDNNSIEATDGNIGKMTAYALGFQTGTIEHVYWTSKEDNVLELDAQDVLRILTGLGEIQSNVWNIQFVAYKNAIENALTVQDVESIVIDYEGQNGNI